MIYIFLDLEWNSFYESHRGKYISEIVDIGAVKVNDKLEITDKFHSFVKPKYSDKLNKYVEKLTNISFDDIVNAEPFEKVAASFEKWVEPDSVILTWSKSDLQVLLDAYREIDKRYVTIPFIHRYADLQPFVQMQLSMSGGNQMGLTKAAELLGVDCSDIPAHRALNDSIVTAYCFIKCFDEKKLKPFICDCNSKEFYDRAFFKAKYVTSIDNELVKPSDLRYYCPYCKRRLRKKGNWRNRNKKLSVSMVCGGCGKEFKAYLQIKITYDDVVKTKNLREIIPHESNHAQRDNA